MSDDDPCTTRTLTADDGSRVCFCSHGGHVLGWTPAGGIDRLWFSRSSTCGPGSAIRGGIPVIWPQFAEQGDGPRHGIARNRPWEVVETDNGPAGEARVLLRLRSDLETQAVASGPFTLTLLVSASGGELDLRLTACNDGDDPFTFTAALHTYLRVADSSASTLVGLEGRTAEQNDGSGPFHLPDGPLTVSGPIDVAVRNPPGTPLGKITVLDPTSGDLGVTADGFDSWVVWNPGAAAPSDVHPGGEREYVCVEPALLHPVVLAPGSSWTGGQLLQVRPDAARPTT